MAEESGGFLDAVAPFAGPVGSVISAIGNIFGGKKAAKEAEKQRLMAYAQQQEFAKHGIQWRVEDARAAGLHPLYALGGSGATFSPPATVLAEGPAMAAAGQDLGRAAQAALTRPETAVIDQQLRNARAQEAKDIAVAQFYDSERARNAQAGITEFPGPGPFTHLEQMGQVEVGPIGPSTVAPGQVQGKAVEQHSRQVGAPNVIAGTHARFMEGEVTPGVTMLFPQQGGQFQEDMTISDVGPWVAANVAKFGWNGFLGRWFAGREKLVRIYGWDAPLVDAIEGAISLHNRRRR